jgi:hypothetical protein
LLVLFFSPVFFLLVLIGLDFDLTLFLLPG